MFFKAQYILWFYIELFMIYYLLFITCETVIDHENIECVIPNWLLLKDNR